MSIIRPAAVGLVLAAGALAGCSTAAPAPTVPAAAPAPTSQAPSASPTTATSTPVAAGEGKCLLSDLRPVVGRTTGEAGQRHTTIVWTNASSSTCTMFGYGGVDLKGPPDPQTDTYSLPRQTGEQPALVRLAPGDKAHTVITWLPSDTTRWTPTKILITPPDETHSAVLDWPGGAVTRQDGATHPGTYLGPIQKGADA